MFKFGFIFSDKSIHLHTEGSIKRLPMQKRCMYNKNDE